MKRSWAAEIDSLDQSTNDKECENERVSDGGLRVVSGWLRYSGTVLNYQETLNHALDRAVIDLLDNADFRKAACSC
jgi:hypothetical protein